MKKETNNKNNIRSKSLYDFIVRFLFACFIDLYSFVYLIFAVYCGTALVLLFYLYWIVLSLNCSFSLPFIWSRGSFIVVVVVLVVVTIFLLFFNSVLLHSWFTKCVSVRACALVYDYPNSLEADKIDATNQTSHAKVAVPSTEWWWWRWFCFFYCHIAYKKRHMSTQYHVDIICTYF